MLYLSMVLKLTLRKYENIYNKTELIQQQKDLVEISDK